MSHPKASDFTGAFRVSAGSGTFWWASGSLQENLLSCPHTSSANSSPTSLPPPRSLPHGPLLAGGSSQVTLPTDLCFYSPAPPLLSLEFKSLSPQSMRVKGTHTQVPRELVKGERVWLA